LQLLLFPIAVQRYVFIFNYQIFHCFFYLRTFASVKEIITTRCIPSLLIFRMNILQTNLLYIK